LKWVRSQPELKHLPVVVLSGSSSPADLKRAYLLGADSFLAKPVDFYALGLELKKIVDFWLHSDYQKAAA